MKSRRRGFWLEFSIVVVIVGSLIVLWVRSLNANESLLLVFSYKSRIEFASANGSLSISAGWNLPSPIALENGHQTSPLDPATPRTPLGRFSWTTFNGRGIEISFPHWLPVILLAALPGRRLPGRKFSFESGDEAS